jgi:hypothetical protein
MPEITEEHFDTDLIEPKEPSINIISKSINNIGRKKKKTRNVQFKSNQQNQNHINKRRDLNFFIVAMSIPSAF